MEIDEFLKALQRTVLQRSPGEFLTSDPWDLTTTGKDIIHNSPNDTVKSGSKLNYDTRDIENLPLNCTSDSDSVTDYLSQMTLQTVPNLSSENNKLLDDIKSGISSNTFKPLEENSSETDIMDDAICINVMDSTTELPNDSGTETDTEDLNPKFPLLSKLLRVTNKTQKFSRSVRLGNIWDQNANKRSFENSAHIDDLPEQLLIKIFSYIDLLNLNSASLVCKKWARLTRRAEARRILFICSEDNSICTELPMLLHSAPLLTHLIFAERTSPDLFLDRVNGIVLPLCENLAFLKLRLNVTDEDRIDPLQLQDVLIYASQLKELIIEIYVEETRSVMTFIEYIAYYRLDIKAGFINQETTMPYLDLFDDYPPLLDIRLSDVNFISDEDLLMLILNSQDSLVRYQLMFQRNLEVLLGTLCDCRNVKFLELGSFSPAVDLDIFCGLVTMSNLTHLSLMGVSQFEEFEMLPIFTDSTGLRNLQSLTLISCLSFGDYVLFAIAKQCTQMVNFTLFVNHSVTDVGVTKLLLHCKKLEHLNLSRVSLVEGAFCSFAESYVPFLQNINIEGCPLVPRRILDRLQLVL